MVWGEHDQPPRDASSSLTPGQLLLVAYTYVGTPEYWAERLLLAHSEENKRRRQAMLSAAETTARKYIIEAVLNNKFDESLTALCEAGKLVELAVDGDVRRWMVPEPDIQQGLLAALGRFEQAGAQNGWDSPVEICRYYGDQRPDAGFIWCARARWAPSTPWIGVNVLPKLSADSMSGAWEVSEIQVYPPDFNPAPNPFISAEPPN